MAQSWFERFQSRNFHVKVHLALADQSSGKVDEIVEKFEQDRYISSLDIGKELNIGHKTVLNRLEKIGHKKKMI